VHQAAAVVVVGAHDSAQMLRVLELVVLLLWVLVVRIGGGRHHQ
jgi:flagellar biogenesis protein FliO